MPLPTYENLMFPVLRAISASNEAVAVKDLITPIAIELGLTEADIAQRLPSGRQGVFHNRIHWAKFYMTKAGLLEPAGRGKSRITQRGRDILNTHPAYINNDVLAQFPSFNEFRAASRTTSDRVATDPELPREPSELISATPVERMEAARRDMERALQEELLERVRAMDAADFEELIVELLLKMGYGQGAEELATALGGSGDGGIDGVVHQDPLGLDRVYIQAKRWKEGNAVGSKEIRDFNGALDIKRAPKGLFVTASSFTKDAEAAASSASRHIVLINGQELARLMVRHRVGTRVRGTVDIIAVDEDFFNG